MKNTKTKIFIAEDYPLFIEAIKAKINLHSDEFDFVGYALNGKEAIEQVKQTEIDILILDISMPQMDGLEVLNYLTEKYPKIKVLVLTMYDDLKHIRQMLKAGANGYMLKNKSGQFVMEALRKIREGEDFLQNEVAQVGARVLMSNSLNKSITDKETILKSLRDYEVQLLELLTLGLIGKEIADRMCVSTKTIETYKKNLSKKIGVKNSLGLVRYAVENGFKK
jgi:DNA-binding NarL/FixJ family response regulator